MAGALAIGQQYAPGPYAPRQANPPRTYPPNANTAATNYNPQNMQRYGQPAARPGLPYVAPGARTNASVPNRFSATNFAPRNPYARNPYSFTNVLPRTSYDTNTARFAPTRTNLPGYAVTSTNLQIRGGAGGSNRLAAPPGGTNYLQPNSTNAQTRLALTPAQRQSIDRLAAVFHAIKNPPVNATQRQQILGTMRAAIRSAPKPSDAALVKLVDDLAAGWPVKAFSYQQKFQLAVDVNRILGSGDLTDGEVLVVINDARRVLRSAGVGDESASLLVDDLAAIAASSRKPSAKENVPVAETEK